MNTVVETHVDEIQRHLATLGRNCYTAAMAGSSVWDISAGHVAVQLCKIVQRALVAEGSPLRLLPIGIDGSGAELHDGLARILALYGRCVTDCASVGDISAALAPSFTRDILAAVKVWQTRNGMSYCRE